MEVGRTVWKPYCIQHNSGSHQMQSTYDTEFRWAEICARLDRVDITYVKLEFFARLDQAVYGRFVASFIESQRIPMMKCGRHTHAHQINSRAKILKLRLDFVYEEDRLKSETAVSIFGIMPSELFPVQHHKVVATKFATEDLLEIVRDVPGWSCAFRGQGEWEGKRIFVTDKE